MADPLTLHRELVAAAKETVNLMTRLETFKERTEADPELLRTVFEAGAGERPDLTQEDYDNMIAAIGQILFTWDSGAPTQKSYFYELL